MEKKRNLQVGIIGGGVAGLFAAWYLAREGGDSVKVSILDRGEFGHGCSWDAAGMLAPVNELEFQETELFHAGMASRKLYDQEVAADLGDIGLVQRGTVEIGLQADDTAYLQRLYAFQREHGQEVEWLSGEKLREREPFLSHHVTHGIWSWVDAQIEHRVLLQQLVKDCQKRGVALHPREEVLSWHPNESGQTIVSSKSGDFVFDKLLVAPGVPSAGIRELLPYKIYPIRGEMIALQPPDDDASAFLQATVRIRNQVLGTAYIVPKSGRVLCGSTSEEKGLSQANTAGGMLDILRKCYAAVPGIYELNIQEMWAGLRPSTLNRLPFLDQEPDTQIFHLNGLFRHGILLGPLLGKAAAQLILKGVRIPEITEFKFPQ